MQVEEIKKYKGKKVLIILRNGFKYTVTIPDFDGNSFTVVDKYNNTVTIDCDSVSVIYEKESDNNGN